MLMVLVEYKLYSKEQNKNYYNLINEFYKLTGVPLVV